MYLVNKKTEYRIFCCKYLLDSNKVPIFAPHIDNIMIKTYTK